ncbi:hypothetical protein DUNSADRAFT_3477 [Dunaliella salina]|uniref:Encoded protein n=1 Tax=Dunaliella salina TaxID=3046 RepID=A0ABQ7GTV2_DUNSA|nr:hypothetical protein DUNSADRAFT_3477 [Dunaliella salina]|eukprot:KAF5838043.1 hypothetical protein DUNSADRAFT_3477 [Dunaliella salina]
MVPLPLASMPCSCPYMHYHFCPTSASLLKSTFKDPTLLLPTSPPPPSMQHSSIKAGRALTRATASLCMLLL